MKRLIFFLFTLPLALLLLSACEPIHLDDEKEKPGGNPPPPVDDDTVSIAGCATVAELLDTTGEEIVKVRGYIVGYIQGTSLNQSAWELPDKVNTNFLIADSPHETDPSRCAPVKLEKTGSYAFRGELNLFDHPELFHRCIVISGMAAPYFKQQGITRIFAYQFIEPDTPDGDGQEGQPGESGKDEDPDAGEKDDPADDKDHAVERDSLPVSGDIGDNTQLSL